MAAWHTRDLLAFTCMQGQQSCSGGSKLPIAAIAHLHKVGHNAAGTSRVYGKNCTLWQGAGRGQRLHLVARSWAWGPSWSRKASSIMGRREDARYSWHRSASVAFFRSNLRVSRSMSGSPACQTTSARQSLPQLSFSTHLHASSESSIARHLPPLVLIEFIATSVMPKPCRNREEAAQRTTSQLSF